VLISTFRVERIQSVDQSIERYSTYYGDDIEFQDFSPLNNSITGIQDWLNITWRLWNDDEIGAGMIRETSISVNNVTLYYYGDENTTGGGFHNVFIQDAYNIPTSMNLNTTLLNSTLNGTMVLGSKLNFTFNVQYDRYYNDTHPYVFTNITSHYILYYKVYLFDFQEYWIWYVVGSSGLVFIGVYFYLRSAGKIGTRKYGLEVVEKEIYKEE
jgi:hypothetical protein